MSCINAAKTLNPLKFAGVPHTPEPISAASGPKFAVLWVHVEEILLFNNFFPIVDNPTKLHVRWCADGDFFASFLRPVFPASRMQHI